MGEDYSIEKVRAMDEVSKAVAGILTDALKGSIDDVLEIGELKEWYVDDIFLILITSIMFFSAKNVLNFRSIKTFGISDMPPDEYKATVISHFKEALTRCMDMQRAMQ